MVTYFGRVLILTCNILCIKVLNKVSEKNYVFTAKYLNNFHITALMAKELCRIKETTPVKVDKKNHKILALLAENARMPASEIAKKVLLSRDAVAYRITRLQKQGVILTFIPIIDLKRFGYYTYQVFLLLDEKEKEKQTALISFLKEHKHTKSIISYTDTWDIEWTLIAKNVQEFDILLTEVITKFSDVILQKETLAVVKGYKSIHLPYYYYYSAGITPKLSLKKAKAIKVDKKDIELLKLLGQNSRQSSYDLGKKLGLSPDAVVYRIRRLTNANIIRQFTTVINLSKLNYSWYTYAINFKKFDEKDDAKFTEFVRKHPHIIRAVKIFGEWDVLLYIVADSPSNYHNTVKEIKKTFSDIIQTYQTWLANEEYIYQPLPKVITESS